MKNPILEIRQKHGLSRAKFGVLMGVVSETVRQLETGVMKYPSQSMLEGLERLGYDSEKIVKDMDKWREHYKEELFSRILA